MEDEFPLVSVIITVYNGERYLRDAIDSILAQTYTNFEIIAVNDGSTDKTGEVLDSYSDKRLRIFEESRQGRVKSLNQSLRLSRGVYIAIQDADDLSLPNRLEIQVKFLEAHPEIAGVGCYVYFMNEEGNKFQIQRDKNALIHGSMMFRRSVIDVIGMYNEEFIHAEDYEFCLRMVQRFKLVNLPLPLYIVREHPNRVSVLYREEQVRNARLAKMLSRNRGINEDTPSGP